MWLGIFEAFHTEFLLAIMIFVDNRKGVNEWTPARYIVVSMVSLFFVGILFLYFFIGFKIRHLINSYYKYAIIEVKDMKNEPLKNILADKNESGNFYQCYFNLINLVRELSFCIALYFLVHFPRIVISILTTLQVINLLLMSLYRPYKKSWMNVNLIITNVLYLMLDVVLACLIFGGDRISKEVKYNVFGFGMIGIVFGLLVCNLGISLYFSIVEFIRKRRRAKEKKINSAMNPQLPDKSPQSNSISEDKSDETSNNQILLDNARTLSFIQGSYGNLHHGKTSKIRSLLGDAQTRGKKSSQAKIINDIPESGNNIPTATKSKPSSTDNQVSSRFKQKTVIINNEPTNRVEGSQGPTEGKPIDNIIKTNKNYRFRMKNPQRPQNITDLKLIAPRIRPKAQSKLSSPDTLVDDEVQATSE